MSAPVATFQCAAAAAADFLSRVGLKAWAELMRLNIQKNSKNAKLLKYAEICWVFFVVLVGSVFLYVRLMSVLCNRGTLCAR